MKNLLYRIKGAFTALQEDWFDNYEQGFLKPKPVRVDKTFSNLKNSKL